MIRVSVPGLPPSVNHAHVRHVQGGRGLTPEAAAWQAGATMLIRTAAAVAGVSLPRKTPLAVSVDLVAPDCYRWDVDNMGKAVCDALAAALGIDDRYICALTLTKQRGPVAETHLAVTVQEG
jgi:Holliday junction resolvase RusA-like endonuclease